MMATRFRLLIPERLVVELIAQADAELPAECCGLLAGIVARDGAEAIVTHRYPLVNELGSPTEFASDPRSMFEAMRDIRHWGTELLAVYHSHPTSEPIPSRKDLERHWLGERVMCLIIGLAGANADVRGWWLNGTAKAAEWLIAERSHLSDRTDHS